MRPVAAALYLVLLAAVGAHAQAIPSAKSTSFDNHPPPGVKTVNNCAADNTSTVQPSTSTLVTSAVPAISTSAAIVVAAASTTASAGAASAAAATTKASGAEMAVAAPLGLGVGLLCAGLVLGAVV